MGASLIALVAAVPAAAQEETPPAAEPTTEEIVVSGIRASLANAARDKEQADQIKDVISAEDIGKLPDTNVAEAMQRITGVQINRDFGEGSEIAVRGFAQNRVEINGQTQIGSDAGGAIAFNTIPSEAFSKIEVVKSPSASDIEGSLGATVRFNTRMPLDNGGKLILSANAQAQYAERADAWTPNISLLASKGWSLGDGEVGVLLGYTRNERKLRQDFFDVRGWEAVNGIGRDLDGDGVVGEAISRDADSGIITDLQDGVYVPLQTRLRVTEQVRKLQSWTGAIQMRPSSRFEFYINGTYSQSKASDESHQVVANLSNAIVPDAANGGSRLGTQYANLGNILVSPDHTVLQAFVGSFNNRGVAQGIGFNLSGASNPPQQDVLSLQTGIKWDATDRLHVEGQLSFANGKQYNRFINTTSGINNADRPFFFFDYTADSDIPTIVPQQSVVGGQRVTAFREDARYDFTNPALYNFANIAINRDRQRTRETALRLDLTYDVGAGPIKSIEFGGRHAHYRGYRSRMRARDAAGAADGTLGGTLYPALNAAEPGLIVGLPFDDLLDGATGDFQRFWFNPDPGYLNENLDRLQEKYGFVFAVDPSYAFDVTRKDQALYAKANLEFDVGGLAVFGNAGLRWIHTDQTATGVIPGGTQGANTLDVVTVGNSYSKLLPSINLTFEPANRLYVRLAAAKSIARPSLLDSAPTIVISDSFDRAKGGNPTLQPQEVNQFDLSIEKYFGKSNLISAAFFYKDFKQRIENGISELCLPTPVGGLEETPGNDGCLVGQDRTRLELPLNVGGATVKGVELGWQQSLDFLPSPLDGLGFIANYTYVDASGGGVSAGGTVLPVQDLSKHSYNLIGYFEKWGFQARAAYNWRSKFYDERTDTNQASFAKAYGQLDASISYDITPNISVSVEGLNLLNEPELRYQELEERLLSYRVNDRRVLFGIRIKN
ncbi:hypothetical protein ATE72_06725 [Sphingopyxis sp. HXXIV]|nr:hypothetical protein ATE72_06725 [Sphingopyxis sp. HXXIV]